MDKTSTNNTISNSSNINSTVTEEKLEKYFQITKKALDMASKALDTSNKERRSQAEDFLNMAQSYYSDARFFKQEKQDNVLAFAAINYAHGWLDAGARIRLFKVNDDQLFTVDKDQD